MPDTLKAPSHSQLRVQLENTVCKDLLGPAGAPDEIVAGTLIEAENQGAAQAVFVVHEFLSDQTKPDKVERNRQDLDRFLHQFPGFRDACLEPGQLLGPIHVPGGEFVPSDIPLLIGKVTTQLT